MEKRTADNIPYAVEFIGHRRESHRFGHFGYHRDVKSKSVLGQNIYSAALGLYNAPIQLSDNTIPS